MTVQKLIDKLNSIEDKNQLIPLDELLVMQLHYECSDDQYYSCPASPTAWSENAGDNLHDSNEDNQRRSFDVCD